MTNEIHDKELVRNLQRGDVFSFDKIYSKYNRKIYAFSLSYLRSREEAEGVVQDVFLILWRKRNDLKDQYNFESYLFTITYNTIRQYFRKSYRETRFLEDYVRTINTDDDSTRTEIEFNDLMNLAEKVIDQLPPRQKAIYHLNMREGLTCEEISKQLRISIRTVENHLQRAKKYLKNALSDERLVTLLFIWLFID
ncbi:MAG: RNA polymerase sigma-70 factor [Bacteroidota bacterium]